MAFEFIALLIHNIKLAVIKAWRGECIQTQSSASGTRSTKNIRFSCDFDVPDDIEWTRAEKKRKRRGHRGGKKHRRRNNGHTDNPS